MPEPDNYTRARNAQTAAVDAANRGDYQLAEHMTSLANSSATLALVDAQREANEIARIQIMLALPATPEQLREAVPAGTVDAERMDRILKGLGL